MPGRSGATAAPSEASLNGFGNEYNYAESLGLSSTTSQTYQQKVRLNATLQGGIYRLSWAFIWGNSSPSRNTLVQLEQDDTTQLWETETAPQDGNATQRSSGGGFRQLVLGAGTYFWDMDFRTSGGPGTARIQTAVVEIFKVSN